MHTVKPQQPPDSPPLFDGNAASLLHNTRCIVEDLRKTRIKIAEEIQPENASFSNVLLPLAQGENIAAAKSKVIIFYNFVSPDPALRQASREAQSLLDDVHAELNVDLFKLVDAVVKKQEILDEESARFLKKTHRKYIQNGFGVPVGPKRDRFMQIKKRLGQLVLEFRQNLVDRNDDIWLTPDELSGVPDDFLAVLEKDQENRENYGKLRLAIKSPDLYKALCYSIKGDTRKRIYMAMENECKSNVPLFRETVVLRDEAARLLGYPSHAALQLEDKMAHTPQVVNDFLTDLQAGLKLGAEEEVKKLREFQAEDQKARGEPIDGKFFIWDLPFYHVLLLKEKYAVNHERIAEYFNLQTTISRMLDIFQGIFSLAFEAVKNEEDTSLAWHKDVQIFSVWDSDEQGGGFLGYLYLDLLSRDGKAGNASTHNIIPGFTRDNGSRNYPATAVVCNFTKPSIDKPSLLQHGHVVILFHEMGHAIHDLVSKTNFACFHGIEVPVDFGETPSQMLENWCWDTGVLKFMSRHYLSPPQEKPEAYQIPDDMIKSLVQAKQVNIALSNLRQVALCVWDLKVHRPESHEEIESMNISAEYNKTGRDVIPLDGPEDLDGDYEWGHGYAKFGHFMGDYAAGYYSYLFSKVHSSDIFHTAFKADPMNSEVGLRYRRQVLEKGDSQDGMKILQDFLGREPNTQAFQREVGIS